MSENQVNQEETQARTVEFCLSGECIGRAVDQFAASLESVITGQGLPLVVRVSKEAMAKLDLLVESGVCKSHSAAALYMLERGIENSETQFQRIAEVTGQIDDMRTEMADWAQAS